MPRLIDDPNMSDATILITVEDLIYRALGSPDECTINFNLLQMILHILARQMRMLEQRVEIREDLEESTPKKEKTPEGSPETSSKSPRSPGKKKGKKEEKDTEKDTDKKKKEETKEKEKAEKLSKKEEKAAKKQKEKAEKERKKLEGGNEREKAWQEKEGAKTARIAETDSRTRANIEVVTQSQFALLEAAVEELKTAAAPRELELPDDEQLKSDIASGTANLPDTMQAMQVNARVKAAEEAINRMAGILTQLAVAGDLDEDLVGKIGQLAAQKEGETKDDINEIKPAATTKSLTTSKSVSIDPKASQSKALSRPSMVTPATPKPSEVTSKASVTSSKISSFSMAVGVTHDEMDSALRELRQELSKDLNNLTSKATACAENALHTAKVVADRLDVVLKVDSRISTLYSLVGDYAEQLSGFDAGLTTQMQGFRDQMAQIRADLQSGLEQLQNVNNNAETAAIMELTERYKELVTELDSTAHAHKALNSLQNELGGEMHSLVECVEMLREQKCDRDEIIDGLRDKADSARLAGLLTEAEFAAARADFERRIELCHDKFRKQDAVWMSAVRDLTDTTDKKAEIVDLLASRDDLGTQLQELHEKIRILAAVLGEPKAAILTRQLAKGAVCAACGAPACMSPREHEGARRPPPPCVREWLVTEPGSEKHVCRRWCGGSHTLLSATTREHAKPLQLGAIPTTHYTDYGDDGRLYMMADELKPCLECNMLNIEGAGDSPAPPPSQGN